MANNIEVQNIGTLVKDFERSAEQITRKELVKALRPGAKLIQKAVLQRAPKRTGALRQALKIKKGRGSSKDPRATLFVRIAKKSAGERRIPPSVYGWFVHNGTVNWGKTKRKHRTVTSNDVQSHGYRIKPNPFVYDAFEASANQAAEKILAHINKNF